MVKFRLSTILLVVALIAIALGWYVDFGSRDRIIGTWTGPASALTLSSNSYTTTLEIRPDGTFSKVQRDGTNAVTFTGTYSILDDGLVKFNVAQIARATDVLDEWTASTTDRNYFCRCAIDATGFLVIAEIPRANPFETNDPFTREPELIWEAYYR